MPGGGESAPKQPKFNPINIPDTIAQALSFDTQGFDASDADFASRFPGLVKARESSIADAYRQLTGPLDPTVQGAFARQGIARAIGAFGGGSAGAGIDPNGITGNTVSAAIANQVQNKQDLDKQNILNLFAQNPERQFGLTGGDVANLSIANTGSLNQNNAIGYQNQVAGANASYAQNIQLGQLIAGLGSSLGGLPTYSDVRLKENIIEITQDRRGIPIVQFNYKHEPSRKYIGVLAQDVLEIFPEAVTSDLNGFLMVDYEMLDIYDNY